MRMIERSLGVLAVVAALALQAAPSQAQTSPSTFIRSDGNDTLDCNDLADRCTSIARGVFTVGPAGNVSLLDSNVHGPVSITKSLAILADGGQNAIVGAAIGSPLSGIHINTASASNIVTIRGVNINQISSAFQGVTFIGSGRLNLENCIIRGSSNGFGINFIPTGPSELHISNCTIADNGNAASGGGILIRPTGSGSAKVVLENVRIDNNRLGILADSTATSGAIFVEVRDSTISESSSIGVGAFEGGGGTTTIMVEGTTSATNGTHGIFASGSGAVVLVRDSVVSGNAAGVSTASSGEIVSHGDNVVAGNTTNGAFTSTLPPQ